MANKVGPTSSPQSAQVFRFSAHKKLAQAIGTVSGLAKGPLVTLRTVISAMSCSGSKIKTDNPTTFSFMQKNKPKTSVITKKLNQASKSPRPLNRAGAMNLDKPDSRVDKIKKKKLAGNTIHPKQFSPMLTPVGKVLDSSTAQKKFIASELDQGRTKKRKEIKLRFNSAQEKLLDSVAINHFVVKQNKSLYQTRSGRVDTKERMAQVLEEGPEVIANGLDKNLLDPSGPTTKEAIQERNQALKGTGFYFVLENGHQAQLHHCTHLATALDPGKGEEDLYFTNMKDCADSYLPKTITIAGQSCMIDKPIFSRSPQSAIGSSSIYRLGQKIAQQVGEKPNVDLKGMKEKLLKASDTYGVGTGENQFSQEFKDMLNEKKALDSKDTNLNPAEKLFIQCLKEDGSLEPFSDEIAINAFDKLAGTLSHKSCKSGQDRTLSQLAFQSALEKSDYKYPPATDQDKAIFAANFIHAAASQATGVIEFARGKGGKIKWNLGEMLKEQPLPAMMMKWFNKDTSAAKKTLATNKETLHDPQDQDNGLRSLNLSINEGNLEVLTRNKLPKEYQPQTEKRFKTLRSRLNATPNTMYSKANQILFSLAKTEANAYLDKTKNLTTELDSAIIKLNAVKAGPPSEGLPTLEDAVKAVRSARKALAIHNMSAMFHLGEDAKNNASQNMTAPQQVMLFEMLATSLCGVKGKAGSTLPEDITGKVEGGMPGHAQNVNGGHILFSGMNPDTFPNEKSLLSLMQPRPKTTLLPFSKTAAKPDGIKIAESSHWIKEGKHMKSNVADVNNLIENYKSDKSQDPENEQELKSWIQDKLTAITASSGKSPTEEQAKKLKTLKKKLESEMRTIETYEETYAHFKQIDQTIEKTDHQVGTGVLTSQTMKTLNLYDGEMGAIGCLVTKDDSKKTDFIITIESAMKLGIDEVGSKNFITDKSHTQANAKGDTAWCGGLKATKSMIDDNGDAQKHENRAFCTIDDTNAENINTLMKEINAMPKANRDPIIKNLINLGNQPSGRQLVELKEAIGLTSKNK